MKNTFSKAITNACLALYILISVGISPLTAQTKKACTNGCADGCSSSKNKKTKTMTDKQSKDHKPIVCKLTSKEMQQRKATVIAELKKGLLERKELSNGYRYKFSGDDKSIDRLVTFIETERQCCGFFTFNLLITEDNAFLELTGPEG